MTTSPRNSRPVQPGAASGPGAAIRPAARLEGLTPYTPGGRLESAPIDLHLDANEGPAAGAPALDAIRGIDEVSVRRYPRSADLERALADRWGVEPERLVVTGGADDAIDRLCRALLQPGRTLLLHTPTFEMIERGGRLAGARVRRIPWLDADFPAGELIDAIDSDTTLIALVTPNNPTGRAIPTRDMLAIADAAAEAGAVVLADLAYAEFADEDPTPELLGHPSVAVVRTFSKAAGMAGLRVGWSIAPARVATWMRTVGGPYPVSGVSLAAAEAMVSRARSGSEPIVDAGCIQRVRRQREHLTRLLAALGASPMPSQANFVCARFDGTDKQGGDGTGADEVRAALARAGIAVRGFPGSAALAGLLRISLPGEPVAYQRLARALTRILSPEEPDPEGLISALDRSESASVDEAAPGPSQPHEGRAASIQRRTSETQIECRLLLDGAGDADVRTGLGFLDHVLASLARHARVDLSLCCAGDLHVDDHHTVEDCALAIGEAIDAALGAKRGIARFGSAFAPLDEALARVVLDLSGRPHASVSLGITREAIGGVAAEIITHFFTSLAMAARCALHADVLRGENDHHRIEAAFKAFALALRQAIAREPERGDVPSTKGVL